MNYDPRVAELEEKVNQKAQALANLKYEMARNNDAARANVTEMEMRHSAELAKKTNRIAELREAYEKAERRWSEDFYSQQRGYIAVQQEKDKRIQELEQQNAVLLTSLTTVGLSKHASDNRVHEPHCNTIHIGPDPCPPSIEQRLSKLEEWREEITGYGYGT